MRSAAALAAVLAATAVCPASVHARPIPLNWHEKFRVQGRLLMTFDVRSLTLQRSGWTARVAFRNRSAAPVRILGHAFGLGLYNATSPKSFFLPALSIAPAPPRVLRPGRAWSGRLRGPGKPAKGIYVRVLFGSFGAIPPRVRPGWRWLTDHAYYVE